MGRGAECQESVVEWDTKCGVVEHKVWCGGTQSVVWWNGTQCGVVGHKIQFQFNGQRFQNKEMSFARDYLRADGKTLLAEYLYLYSFVFSYLSQPIDANKSPISHNAFYIQYWISFGKCDELDNPLPSEPCLQPQSLFSTCTTIHWSCWSKVYLCHVGGFWPSWNKRSQWDQSK